MTCTTTSPLVSYLYPDQPSANSQPLARGRSLAEYKLLASGLVVVQVADRDLPLGGSLGAGHRLLVMVQAASRVQVSTLTGGRPVAVLAGCWSWCRLLTGYRSLVKSRSGSLAGWSLIMVCTAGLVGISLAVVLTAGRGQEPGQRQTPSRRKVAGQGTGR